MEHLKNFLLGMGEVLTAFGTAPDYKYPKVGDRVVDNKALHKDAAAVAGDMRAAAAKVVREAHVKIENGPVEKQGPTAHLVGSRNRLATPADSAS